MNNTPSTLVSVLDYMPYVLAVGASLALPMMLYGKPVTHVPPGRAYGVPAEPTAKPTKRGGRHV